MIKFLKIAGVLILLAAVAVSLTLYAELDMLIKTAIVNVGPRITQTTVELSSVHVSPFSGKGRIRGLVIGNPKGFQAPTALQLKDVRVSLVPKSLAQRKMVIQELIVDGPEITYEITRSGNNLQAIQKNIESFVPASKPGAKPAAKKEAAAQKTLELDFFDLKNAEVRVVSHVFGTQQFDIPLPEITLRDIGRGPKGATAKEVVSAVFHSITSGVTKAVTSSGVLKNLHQSLNSATGTIQKGLKSLFGK